MPSEEV
jgi:E3 ubiquitin-protein ligase TRIP12